MGDIEKDIQSSFPNERVKALVNIKFTSGWLDQIGNRLLKPFKISEQQYNILRILRGAKEAVSVNTVKERMVQKSPNSTRLMDKLCEKGLIRRTRCENDRRVVYVEITNQGLAMLDQIDFSEFYAHFDKLTSEEARTLNILLDKIR
jgi:DNA-binding MarR family transcriptional regulator